VVPAAEGDAPDGAVTRRAHVVINPFAGVARGLGTPEAKATLARAVLARAGVEAEVTITRGPEHAAEVTASAAAAGTDVVAAWGGDGTVHVVARALVGHDTALAIVPQGSGNGLARELGVPLDPAAALEVVATGQRRRIDVGLLGDEPFFNVAGVGLDARVAYAFATNTGRRGLLRYVQLVVGELLRYRPIRCRIEAGDGPAFDTRVVLIAFANSRQYGNNACIAPKARLDDGRIDVVVVVAQPLWRIVRRIPALFRGTLEPEPGLIMRAVDRATVSIDGPVPVHVDGEPRLVDRAIEVRVRPAALVVVAPGG
jgi:diacylglycerol kinase (ATP)